MPKTNYPSIENEQNKLQTSLTFVTQYFFPKVWLDYARVIVSALWKRLDQESIVKNKAKVSSSFFTNFLCFNHIQSFQVGPSMINRSWAHVKFITERLCNLLL